MSNLVNVPPTSMVQRADAFIFYYGIQPSAINHLPGDTQFVVVYSPTEEWEWEFVRFQVFSSGNGVYISERRKLELDEIAYFQSLIAASKHTSRNW